MNKLFTALTSVLILLAGCELNDPLEPGLLVPKTVDEDFSLPSISVNGAQLHSESFGNALDPMVVVIHGGPGSDYRSLLNCSDLTDQGFFVVFYDQRGAGLSQREDRSVYSMQLILDDLGAVIQHYRSTPDQKVILLGHSWGGIVATAYINKYPDAVDGAILAEPGGFVWNDILDYVGRVQDYKLTSETLSDLAYTDQFFTGIKKEDHDLMDYKMGLTAVTDGIEGNILGNEDFVPFWRFGAVFNNALSRLGEKEKPDWTGNLAMFQTKVLFIYSERNKAYGLDHAVRVSSAYPIVELVRIDGAGHDMIAFPTGWNNLRPYILDYLNTIQ